MTPGRLTPNGAPPTGAKSEPAQGELFDATPPLPEGLVYQPDFITAAEEAELLAEIGRLPLREAQYKSFTAKRRVQSFGVAYDFRTNTLQPGPPLPSFLMTLREKVARWVDLPAERFAHGLVTEYRPGTQLGWHRDAPEFAVIVGISLLGPCRMRFRPYPPRRNKREETFALTLEPRSAYVMRGPARWSWQHSIPPTKTLRYSITFRTRRKR
ncbi:MAG TPA: alpha-ketoglutarate-dependent dioxygenase AlkB [Burkholderiales bacterium]